MPSMQEFSTWLTPSEAGGELGISRQAVHKHLRRQNKTFRAVRTHFGWLIDPASVDAYKKRRRDSA